MREFKYTVTEEDVSDGLSIKDLMRRRFSFSSRLRTKIKQHRSVWLNGEEMPVWITPKAGDVITVGIPDETSYFEPEDVPIIPVYEDDDLLIINKPPGYVVHPTKGHNSGTIANGVSKYMLDKGESFKIRFINRLDMDTSGILALGKNSHAQDDFVKQQKRGLVQKRYNAIVHGSIEEEDGIIDLPLGFGPEGTVKRIICEDGKPSETHYKVLERFKDFTFVELELKTGRTHQIRVHMAAIGHPVAGDFLYGSEEPEVIGRQALHAALLSFAHPVSGRSMTFKAPLPEDMASLLDRLRAGEL